MNSVSKKVDMIRAYLDGGIVFRSLADVPFDDGDILKVPVFPRLILSYFSGELSPIVKHFLSVFLVGQVSEHEGFFPWEIIGVFYGIRKRI
jgi:hypothetical protein